MRRAQPVEARVDHDAVQPGGDRCVAAEGPRPAERRDQGLLQGVGGVLRVAHGAQGHRPEPVAVPREELAERGLIGKRQASSTSPATSISPRLRSSVNIDRDRAAALGVSIQSIETALGASFGGQQISIIETPVDQFKVILELLPRYQQDAASLERLYLTGSNGVPVPLSAVADITTGSAPLAVNHFGQLPAVTISFSLPPNVALSDAVATLTRVQSRAQPSRVGVQGSFQGTAKAFEQSMQGMGFLLAGAILVVYLVLGILYESFVHPLTILSGLPAAAVGALLTLYLFGVPLTLYAFVGMIMLVGIVKKNAIMMIDFALVREREHGIAADRGDRRSRADPLPPDHDDDHGGADGQPSHRARLRPGRLGPPAARPRRRRRPDLLAGADALHHAGDLRHARPRRPRLDRALNRNAPAPAE